MLGDGQMLWLHLPQMVVMIRCQFRLIAILDVLHVVAIVTLDMVRPSLTFNLCLGL